MTADEAYGDNGPLRRCLEGHGSATCSRVAGARWTIEEGFQTGKNETAFDHYQVRLYPAWYRYITLAMLALPFLAVTRAALRASPDPPARTGPLVEISANEIRSLFALLTRPLASRSHILHWSRRRRRHQARARQRSASPLTKRPFGPRFRSR
ncbi:hypothetical protein HD593_007205 [Nonomuraea rubra]|uniref:Transposase IS701-like DDE domain-containing protein n=1 Tax=Nonomuraea rubra TaxID=46180 RepID=A0A7X0NZB6_9ACTN|nr:hypothetical protein [Nonomuraea rubra]